MVVNTRTRKQLNKYNKKTRKQPKKKIQSGAGVFTINNKIYSNISYRNRENAKPYITNSLICLQCKHNIFRRHDALHSSRLRSFMLDTDVFDKSYNIFVCTRCGFMMNYSGRITYNSTKTN